MTFEKVLEVFNEFLIADVECEVVTSKRGYLVLFWLHPEENEYVDAEHCESAEKLMQSLLSLYKTRLEVNITDGSRKLTPHEAILVETQGDLMRKKCYC